MKPEWFDVKTECVLLKSPISQKAQAMVVTYGDVDVAALEKLIALLVQTRNNWTDSDLTPRIQDEP